MGCRNTNELLSETNINSKHIVRKFIRIHDIHCPQLTASRILSLRQVSFDNDCPSVGSVQVKLRTRVHTNDTDWRSPLQTQSALDFSRLLFILVLIYQNTELLRQYPWTLTEMTNEYGKSKQKNVRVRKSGAFITASRF